MFRSESPLARMLVQSLPFMSSLSAAKSHRRAAGRRQATGSGEIAEEGGDELSWPGRRENADGRALDERQALLLRDLRKLSCRPAR
jgi:hypothetical protein